MNTSHGSTLSAYAGHMGSRRTLGRNKWELRVYVGRFDGREVYKSRTFRGTAREADRELARMTLEAAAGDFDPPDSTRTTPTVEEWVRRRVKRQSSGWSPTTLATAQVVLDHHLGRLADMPLDEVRLRDVDQWVTDMLRTRTAAGSTLSPGSVRRYWAIINAAFEQAERWEMVASNPGRHVELPKVPYQESNVPTAEDLAAVLAACKNGTERTFVWLAAATGGRRGQLVGLRWSDFDLDAGILTFHRTVIKVPGGWDTKPPKAGKPITLAVDPATLQVVTDYRKQRARELRGVRIRGPKDTDYIFWRGVTDPAPWYPDTASRLWVDIRSRVPALEGVRLHDLRHAHATWLSAAGVDPKTGSTRLGHATTAMFLDRYTHRVSDADRAASEIIDRLLVGKTAEVTELPVDQSEQ